MSTNVLTASKLSEKLDVSEDMSRGFIVKFLYVVAQNSLYVKLREGMWKKSKPGSQEFRIK